jgi:hypothetical protein
MVNPLGPRNKEKEEREAEQREYDARAPLTPWARPALHDMQAAPRCKALRVLTALPGAAGAQSDCGELDRLLGSPRVPGGCFEVVLFTGARRARQRVDVAAESVLGLSCGRDHVLLHASRRGAGSCAAPPVTGRRVLLGLGNSWTKQVRQEWEAKPPGCLITFSGPAETDFEFPWLDVFVDPLVVKRSPIDSPKGPSAFGPAASPPRPEQQPRREPRPAADLEPEAITAFSATGGPHSCVAFGCTARWGRRTLVLPKPVTLVAAGTSHCVFLCSDRRAFGYGEHVAQGQLGYYVAPAPLLSPRRGGAAATAAAAAAAAAAKHGTTSPQKLTARPAPSHSYAQQQRGSALQVEIPEVPDEFRLPRHPVLLAVGVTTLAAAFETTLLCAGPKVWSPCGAFEHFFDETVEQLACGRSHAVALLKESRRVMAWGSNDRGAVGVSRPHHPIGGHYPEPQLVNGRLGPLWPKEQVAEVAAGEHYSMLRTRAGDVYLWGSICRGDIALRPQPVQLGGGRKSSAIAAGPTYCVVVGERSSNCMAP